MKKILSIIMVICMIATTLLSFSNQSYALTTYQKKTFYHLDLGAIHIWGTGDSRDTATWQNGYAYGNVIPVNSTLNFNNEVESCKAYVLDEDTFQWGIDPPYSYNGTPYLRDDVAKANYVKYYSKYVSSSITNITCTPNGKKVTLSSNVKLKSSTDFDLVSQLNAGGFDSIINLLGGDTVPDQYPELYQRLYEGKDGGIDSEHVFGYLVLVPIVIESVQIVPVTIDINEFDSGIDVPSTAKVGESFNVTDISVFGDESQFACTQLTYSVDGGSSKTVTNWAGDELGETISQSFDEPCTVKYTLTAWNTYGEADPTPATGTIQITSEDEIEITVEPDLVIPSTTYEGHTEVAKDESIFTVDGTERSATYTYANDLASNSFKADDSSVDISRLTDTTANYTFGEEGTVNATLRVRPHGGSYGSDTESIEVLKTPYINASLGGTQKQNREQDLVLIVGTYPGQPITSFNVVIKDPATGDQATVTNSSYTNGSTIKVRPAIVSQDLEEGYAYITVQFLTKTPSYAATGTNNRNFNYEVHVEDAKGDTDDASSTFVVRPDLPPQPSISIDPAFLRNEGTNVATIKAEDTTVAVDGDSVERTYYYGATTAPTTWTDVSTMANYQKLSFGTDKIVGFNRTGVGKLSVKLSVKDVWTEPTLEEYVTAAEHLTGSVTGCTDVLNVAPVVALELSDAIPKDVLLLANSSSEYNTLLNKKTTLKQALLADKIDANIIIKKLLGATPVTSITTEFSLALPAPTWGSGGMTDEPPYYSMAADSERVYIEQWKWGTKSPTTPVVVKAYNPYTGAVLWTYTATRNENISFGQDDQGKYLYLLYSDLTILLDKRTGAVAGTIAKALPSQIWLTDDSFYYLESGTFYRTDQNTLDNIAIDTQVSSISKAGNKFKYITRTSTGVVVNTYDPLTSSVTKRLLIDTTNGKGASGDYIGTGIGADGTVVVYKAKGNGTDTFNGVRIYSPTGTLTKQISVGVLSNIRGVYMPGNESGLIDRVVIHQSNRYDYTFTGVNLDNGTVKSFSDDSYSSNASIASCYESGGTVYLYSEGWYLYSGAGYCGKGFAVAFNGSSVSSTSVGKIGSYDEAFASSDRFFTTLFGDNSGVTNGTQIKVSAIPQTAAQETAQVIAKYSDEDTYIGGIGTTAAQVKADTINQPQNVMKVTASKDGYLTLSAQSLTPGKKYYYEYEIDPLTDGTSSRINGITASTGTSTSGQTFAADTLYVSESHEEDFNDTNIDSFFTVDNGGVLIPDGFSAYNTNAKGYGAYNGDDDDGTYDTGMQLSFTVPTGKQAIVTLDFHMSFTNRGYDALSNNAYRTASVYDNMNVFVDGNTIRDFDSITNNFETDALGAIYYQVLGSGTHTVGCSAYDEYDWSYVLMDNLRVDILSTTPKTLTSSFNISEGDQEDWLSVGGTFETPSKIISYGSQTSTTYYGALPSEVTDTRTYHKKVYPSEITYYQTVPAGYIQKGQVHFTGSVGPGDEVGFFPYNSGEYRYEEKSSMSSYLGIDSWRSIGALMPGTYSHYVETEDYTYSTGRMDAFSIVQYPYNAVTATGNIAFNSTNTEYFFPKVSSTQLTNLSMFVPKGQYYLKNFRIYYFENGQKIYVQDKALTDITQLSPWTPSVGVTVANASMTPTETEDPIRIYKKGEKVIYNIFYDDYELDPSKAGYWIYNQVAWPPDVQISQVGQTLTAPIDRFYSSGKYTVTHWEVDNTQRTGTVGDSTPYNKESNKVTMTFYVDGEGKAPWVTYIKTIPSTVKENNSYTIQVDVDDEEKDTLALTTEVYLNGTLIKTDTKTSLTADSNGDYPAQTISGLATAVAGVYQVVCTVSDYSGTGIKAYKFTVVSEGKITGYVNHTDQWNINRMKYNLAKSGDSDSPRAYNVFWSGEKFVLRADVTGSPTLVTSQILGNTYSTTMTSTGAKNSSGETIYSGTIWDEAMINKWGNDGPEPLTFRFTATYSSGTTKTNDVSITVDNEDAYFELHRYF